MKKSIKRYINQENGMYVFSGSEYCPKTIIYTKKSSVCEKPYKGAITNTFLRLLMIV